MLARFLDRKNRRLAEMLRTGVNAGWHTCHLLSSVEQARCFEFASQLTDHFLPLLDKPSSTYDVVWCFASNASDASLQNEYARNLALSHRLEASGDVALWAAPTFAQFSLGAEILRRKMRTHEGKAVAKSAGQAASYKIGCLTLGQMPRT